MHMIDDLPRRRRRMLRRNVYRELCRLARDDPARLGAVLGVLEHMVDDLEAVSAALRLIAWAGAPDGDHGGDDGGSGANG